MNWVKKKTKKRAKRNAAKKPKSISLAPLKRAMTGVGKLAKRALKEGPEFDEEANLPAMRDAVQELQDAVAGFKREIKRRMLADPRLKDGAIRTKDRIIHLKLRSGAKPRSKNPDDYDIVTETIN